MKRPSAQCASFVAAAKEVGDRTDSVFLDCTPAFGRTVEVALVGLVHRSAAGNRASAVHRLRKVIEVLTETGGWTDDATDPVVSDERADG